MLADVGSPGNALRAALSLIDAADRLSISIVSRNGIIKDFKSGVLPQGFSVQDMVFAISRNQVTHSAYKDSVKSMCKNTDDLIFFSLMLCNYLSDYGVSLKKIIRNFLVKK